MIIPLIMFLDYKDKEGWTDYLYLACFILIFIPLVLPGVDYLNNGIIKFGFKKPYLITYGVLIQNVATFVMTIALIIEGFLPIKIKKLFKHS